VTAPSASAQYQNQAHGSCVGVLSAFIASVQDDELLRQDFAPVPGQVVTVVAHQKGNWSASRPDNRSAGPPTVMPGEGAQPQGHLPEWHEHYSKILLDEFKALATAQSELAERLADRARQTFLFLRGAHC